jgi:hypothetical protein
MKTTLPAVGLTPEPVELPPASGVAHVMTHDEEEIQLAPAPPPPPPRIVASDVPRGSVQIETDRDDEIRPPKNASLYWALTNNVFEFPFRWCALTQWIFSSIGLAATGVSLVLSVMGMISASMAGGLQAGVFALVGLLFLLFSVSYVTSCFVDIAVNAAHNIDKAHDWPNPDYRDRLMFLVRVVWVATLSGTAASGVTLICALAGEALYIVFFPVFGVLFPILLLAGLEADSLFWPVSKPIFQSVKVAWRAWLSFYLIAGAMWTACGLLTWVLAGTSPLLMPIVMGPIWAAAIFIYGRLLGRLAWFILHKVDLSDKKKPDRRAAEQDRWRL